MPISPTGFVNPQAIASLIKGPRRYTHLYICAGIVLVHAQSKTGTWYRPELEFLIPDAGRSPVDEDPSPCLAFWHGEVFSSIAPTAWVASFGAEENDFGFAVDEVHASWEHSSGRIKVVAMLAVKGDIANIYRVGYHVSFLAHLDKKTGPDGRTRELE
jgi:hypothetical protein